VLNITPDHLDRYNYELEKYADSKVSIAKNQKLSDRLLVLADQQTIAPALRRQSLDTNITTISPEDVRGTSVFIDGYEFNMGTGSLRGRHNGLNALFAIRIAMKKKFSWHWTASALRPTAWKLSPPATAAPGLMTAKPPM
jgi:UDP-N-acetylmuramoylalanine--D-glutamate ligase